MGKRCSGNPSVSMCTEGPSGKCVPEGLLCLTHKVGALARASPEGRGIIHPSPVMLNVLYSAGVPTEEVLS